MTDKPQHTPTPWTLDKSAIIWGPYEGSGTDYPMITDDPNMSDEDKAFIVRAVNAYEKDQEIKKELLRALIEAEESISEGREYLSISKTQIRETIAKAEAQ